MANPTTLIAPLFTWRDIETARWREFFAANPSALDFKAGDGSMATVRGLVRHIFAVELRYGQRLTAQPVTDWPAFTQHGIAELFAIGDDARRMIDRYMAVADEASLAGTMTFTTLTAGEVTATRRKILVNVVTHGVRHWAQVTTYVRQGGIRASWPHDLLGNEVGM
ncbi:MAG: DinB family protein [Gemmatimonadaceae bacterium]